MQYMRRKFRGWNYNTKGKNKKEKIDLLNKIKYFELIQETRDLNFT
jgi:hypothetical protein